LGTGSCERTHAKFLSASQSHIKFLQKYFYAILELYQEYNGEQMWSIVNQITVNLGNLQELLQHGIHDTDGADTICCILSLSPFYRITGCGYLSFIDHIEPMLPQPRNYQLEIQVITEMLDLSNFHPAASMLEELLVRAIALFEHVTNPLVECESLSFLENFLVS
jgi:hypothetical protein